MNKDKLLTHIKNIFNERIEYDEINKKYFSISLPMYLDTGSIISINIVKENNQYEFSNNLYKEIELLLKKSDLVKEYLLKKDKLCELKEEFLTKNSITINESLSKIVICDNEGILSKEIFFYAHYITSYYNQVYSHILSTMKTPQLRNILKLSVEQFINNYNLKYQNKINKIEDFDFLSNSYFYKTKSNKVITTANNKQHLAESLLDLQLLKNSKEFNSGVVILEVSKKNGLSESYIDKFSEKFQKLKIEFYPITERENIDSIEYKNLMEKLK